MLPTLRLLASHTHPRDISLLPPLQLYRRLLRAHRHKLPPDARLLGDEYVKREFRLHRDVTNPLHIVGFLTEWQLYAQELEGDTWREGKLDTAKVEKMSREFNDSRWMDAIKSIRGEGGGGFLVLG